MAGCIRDSEDANLEFQLLAEKAKGYPVFFFLWQEATESISASPSSPPPPPPRHRIFVHQNDIPTP